MKTILTAVLLAASLVFAAPALSQDKASAYTVHLVDNAPKEDALAQSLYKALDASMKSHSSANLAVSEVDAEKADPSAPVIHFLSVAVDDKNSVVIVAVEYHIQGQIYGKHIGVVAGKISATDNVDELATELLHRVGGAVVQFESDESPAPAEHAQQN